MAMKSLKDLYIHELQDLCNAEKQLVDALPKMEKAANSQKLKDAFGSHLEETKHQLERVEQLLQQLGESTTGTKCEAMEGLIKEGEGLLKEDTSPEVKDAGLIAAAQRVEHYEIAGYGTACSYAKSLGEDEAAKVLDEILKEESAADDKLNDLALAEINERAHAVAS